MSRTRLALGLSVLTLSLVLACTSKKDDPVVVPAPAAATPSTTAWSFAVMADTQWTGSPDDGKNPNTVAVAIIDQLNKEFVAKGVKFVVQVGDITDDGSKVAIQTRARHAQALYNAGIGFFPMRGNHEDKGAVAATEFARVFPQTADGGHNNSPADVLALKTADDANLDGTVWIKTKAEKFTCGSGLSSPSTILKGLSYTFAYNNANFVVVDGFKPLDGSAANIPGQQAWIDATLKAKPAGNHAFFFTHKGLITPNHTDILFGANPAVVPDAQNAFLSSLATNGVRYYINGHDHIHQRSQILSPDGKAKITEITCASDSSKFYIPLSPSNDGKYNTTPRETPLAQDRNSIGYYIYTVDGPRVTVDYYAAPTASLPLGDPSWPEYLISSVPKLTFTKRESFGYSLNGKEFNVTQGQAYTNVQDGIAKLISGTNGSALKEWLTGRKFTHAVNTGWTPKTTGLYTDILTLWGMGSGLPDASQDYADPTKVKLAPVDGVDTYCLAMSYDPALIGDKLAQTGQVGIAIKGATNWVNAVSGNTGGTKAFVAGAYDGTKHGLGTYGVDTTTHTFWVVVNFNGDFAVAPSI